VSELWAPQWNALSSFLLVEPEKFILFSAFSFAGFLIRGISRGDPLALWMSIDFLKFLIPHRKGKRVNLHPSCYKYLSGIDLVVSVASASQLH